LSIVIPAFNEEHRLGRMLDAYLPWFEQRYGADVEFLVVVNGSTDATETVARAREGRWPSLRVLVEPRAIGKGGAILKGMTAARGELVGFVDADGATPPEAFEDLVRRIDDAGIIIANRWDPASRIAPQPWRRRVASRAFNALVRTLFRLPIRDTQCGAKVMRREAMQIVQPHLGLTRWAFDVDLLFHLRRAGYAIRQAPTVWHDEQGSRLRVVRASLEMFVAIVRLRLLYSPFRWVVTAYDWTLGPLLHRESRRGQPATAHAVGKSRHWSGRAE